MEYTLGTEPATGKDQKLVVQDINASLRVNRVLMNTDGTTIITGESEYITIYSSMVTTIAPDPTGATELPAITAARAIAQTAIADALVAYYKVVNA